MLGRHFLPARRYRLRIDSDGPLNRRRAVDGKEDRFAERLLRIAPAVERMSDLLGDLLLERHERIVLRDRFAILAHLLRQRLHRGHEGIVAAEKFVLKPQRMQIAHRLRHLRRHQALDPGLEVLLVGGEIDLGHALGCGETPFVLGRIAAHGADVIQRPGFAAHHPLPDGEIGIRGIRVLGLESRLIEAGRQYVDQVDVAGEFRKLLLGNAAGNEDAEMAYAFVNRVDNRLSVGPDFVDVGIEIEDPVQRLLRRRDVVALGAKYQDRRSDIAQIDRLTVRHLDPAGGEVVADEEFVDDELNLLGIQVDMSAPPAFEFEVSFGLGIDL